MNRILIGLVFFVLICFSCKNKSKDQLEISTSLNVTDTAPVLQRDIKQEEDIIRKVSTSFYEWYIKTIKASNDSIPFDFIIVEGENGKCKVDFEPYFNELRKLKTISNRFLEKEILRSKDCSEHMKTVDWSEFQNSDAYDYEEYCPCYSYMYWLKSQEPYDGVSILEMDKKNDVWFVKLQLYNIFDNKRHNYNYFYPIIRIENENGSWMMTEIELKNEQKNNVP